MIVIVCVFDGYLVCKRIHGGHKTREVLEEGEEKKSVFMIF